MQTYYDLLGVSENASDAEIEAAFKGKAREVHPDKIPPNNPYLRKVAAEAFKDLSEAKSVLLDHTERQKYDAGLAYMRGSPASSAPPPPQPSPQAPPQPGPSANPGHQHQSPPAPTPPPPPAKKQSFWRPSNTPFGLIALTAGGIGCLLLLGGMGYLGLAFLCFSLALLSWRHGMRSGTDAKVLGGSVFLFLFAVAFFSGWIESPSSNSKQTNSTPSQGATPSASPAPITAVPCKKVTAEACVGTATPNKLVDTAPATKSSELFNPQPPAHNNPITATAKDSTTESSILSTDTSSSRARAAYIALRTGERLHVTSYQLLGDKYRLQLQGGWVDVSTSDVVSIEPELPTKQTAMSVSKTWKNLRDGQTYRTHVDGDTLYLESTNPYPKRTGNIANCKFHRAVTPGLSWAGECWERNPKDQSIYKSDATIATFSETRIDMGTRDMTTFAMIPADGVTSYPSHDVSSPQIQAPSPTASGAASPRSEIQAPEGRTSAGQLKMSTLTVSERQSIQAACSNAKYLEGPAAYNKCLDGQLALLATAPAHPDLSGLSVPEHQSIEAACSNAKYLEGPAAYNKCLDGQLAILATAAVHPDLSGLSVPEHQSIEAACSNAKYLEGPAAYNKCLQGQLAALSKAPRRPDLSSLTLSERQSIEAACSNAKYLEGPAAYNRCLLQQLDLLKNDR